MTNNLNKTENILMSSEILKHKGKSFSKIINFFYTLNFVLFIMNKKLHQIHIGYLKKK